jgi:hypothetical protein
MSASSAIEEYMGTWAKPHGHWEWLSADEVEVVGDLAPQPPADDGDFWGPWIFHRKALELEYRGGHYFVDLARCRSSAEVLDWIAQVSGKAWITREDVGYFVEALDDLLDLQGNICGFGFDYRIVPAEILQTRPSSGRP